MNQVCLALANDKFKLLFIKPNLKPINGST